MLLQERGSHYLFNYYSKIHHQWDLVTADSDIRKQLVERKKKDMNIVETEILARRIIKKKKNPLQLPNENKIKYNKTKITTTTNARSMTFGQRYSKHHIGAYLSGPAKCSLETISIEVQNQYYLEITTPKHQHHPIQSAVYLIKEEVKKNFLNAMNLVPKIFCTCYERSNCR